MLRITWGMIYLFRLRNFPILRRIVLNLERQFFCKKIAPYFNRGFYEGEYPDLDGDVIHLLGHYINYGAFEGRNPSLIFNSLYYSTQHCPNYYNPIVHFVLFGESNQLSPSPYFDYNVYLEKNEDVKLSNIAPFLHFFENGVKENRTSNLIFNPLKYIQDNEDVSSVKVPALEHYLTYGKSEGRYQRNDVQFKVSPKIPLKYFGSLDKIRHIKPRAVNKPVVDVIIPVYGAREETINCIYSVLKSKNKKQYRLIVVDDCSPDKELSRDLREIEKLRHIKLIKNKVNKGFVSSVNRGMRMSKQDVVLLNSDTEVYNDWLDRLSDIAYMEAEISTVTPMSNNATILSYPRMNMDTDGFVDIECKALDGFLKEKFSKKRASKSRSATSQSRAEVNKAYIPIPTAVGFCMFIKREVLSKVGLFDEEAFGRGYGEENDFCLKAQAAGYHDVVAINTFVKHFGSSSFKLEKKALVKNAVRILNKRYPSYSHDVQRFIQDDPLLEVRRFLDEKRISNVNSEKNVLIISHVRGGGTEQNVQEQILKLRSEGISCYRLRAGSNSRMVFDLSHSDVEGWNLASRPISELNRVLSEYDFDKAIIHHMADFGDAAQKDIVAALNDNKIKYDYIVHDYFTICPRINLIESNDLYCGEPDYVACNKCLRTRGSEFISRDIEKWRLENYEILSGASHVIVPDVSVKNRLLNYFPKLNIDVVPHEVLKPICSPRANKSGVYRIGAIGAISNIKGLKILHSCSETSNQTLTYHIIGYTSDPKATAKAKITTSGKYRNHEVADLIENFELDAIFIPSCWPETYSYTLSLALKSGLPIIVFDMGAPAARLRELDDYSRLIIPFSLDSRKINKLIFNFLNNLNSEAD